MNNENEKKRFFDDETEELNIEHLTDVQGGLDDFVVEPGCGLGCYLGSGTGGNGELSPD